MAKRGESGICCVVGVDKPSGMTSHDVVNVCRRAFGERRVGHTGTLDPLATGVLTVCVGPATRLDSYLTAQDKTYEVRISFGAATDTDDSQGQVIHTAPVPPRVCDEEFARNTVAALVGAHKQVPPVYSAIKRDGTKAYEAARKGVVVQLEPRDIEIYDAQLVGLERNSNAASLYWDVRVHVSKGTYIRALARDVGLSLHTAAHVERLRRVGEGRLSVDACMPLERMSDHRDDAIVDPVALLGYPTAFLDEGQLGDVANGKRLAARDLAFYDAPSGVDPACCALGRSLRPSDGPLAAGQRISLVANNELKAIYQITPGRGMLTPCCVFAQGVCRGRNY